MRHDKQLINRKGRNGGCRSRWHAYVMAEQQYKREFFMSHREMRKYWEEPNSPIYGPLSLMTRWLRIKMRKEKNE